MKVAQGPKYAKDVGELRVTKGVTQDGKEFIRKELWKNLQDQHERVEPFTGTTEFLKLSDCQLNDIKGMHEVSCVLPAMQKPFRVSDIFMNLEFRGQSELSYRLRGGSGMLPVPNVSLTKTADKPSHYRFLLVTHDPVTAE